MDADSTFATDDEEAMREIPYGTTVRVTGCLTGQHNGQTGEFREWCRLDGAYLIAFENDSCWTATMERA